MPYRYCMELCQSDQELNPFYSLKLTFQSLLLMDVISGVEGPCNAPERATHQMWQQHLHMDASTVCNALEKNKHGLLTLCPVLSCQQCSLPMRLGKVCLIRAMY